MQIENTLEKNGGQEAIVSQHSLKSTQHLPCTSSSSMGKKRKKLVLPQRTRSCWRLSCAVFFFFFARLPIESRKGGCALSVFLVQTPEQVHWLRRKPQQRRRCTEQQCYKKKSKLAFSFLVFVWQVERKLRRYVGTGQGHANEEI